MKQLIKTIAEYIALPIVAPAWIWFLIGSIVLGRARAFTAIGQRSARWPGTGGEYLRRVLLRRILARLGKDVVISFGTVLTKPSAELADGVYIGLYCTLGDVRIGDNTLIGDHVCIPSGPAQHGLGRLDVPIRDQKGTFQVIHIGCDGWIGSGSVILADVGSHCVVAAGSVVTKPVDDYQIVAGNPARPIGDRREIAAQAAQDLEMIKA